jgi:hypothetical protein
MGSWGEGVKALAGPDVANSYGRVTYVTVAYGPERNQLWQLREV